ncbi:LOW QUALITY PROTEIN: protein phosphatase 1 regulatory subunit 26 [Sphaerodactylus townsendi]|uniref:LOW QUALITY PROTEIN: protein phosphatase 1 regulatory subunit 26 n=1 Tax=Sphaerodactylus townsendi TaxID=933632 RepID=UPI002025DDED|nr:LOW QUALITY PROTEIN: protein phosphatase 1 regulatory subunit 26 [Sphaerodactylus townsendi]
MCRPSHSPGTMFLMNTSPLVALQRKWEPFAQTRSCRYPVCFSESEDDIGRTSISTKVQMIINNLQSEDLSLAPTSEYGCILQEKIKGVKFGGHKLRSTGRLPPQGCAKHAQDSCPADSDGMDAEEGSEFGPLSLNSDSDDSVDREIEEAIQEYLKNKGRNLPPLPGTHADKSLRKEQPSCAVACNVFPAGVKANGIPQHLAPDFLGDDTLHWAPSPCSVSSDDSFEQSIKAEIEQFLNEKKQQTRKKTVSGGSKSLDQKEAREKLTSQKKGTSKTRPGSFKRGGKAFLRRRKVELQNTSTPPKCLMLKTEELVGVKKTSQIYLNSPGAAHSCMLEQSNNGEIRQKFWKDRGEQGPESLNISDSSSDDGIEEAIQLYQLEKVRKAANAEASHVPFQKEEFGAGELAHISASLTIRSDGNALPENTRTAIRSSKRKHLGSKPTELNRISAICNEQEKNRCCTSPANSFASSMVTSQSCRADTAAELMCAEAILDISKTILPLPVSGDNRSLLADPFFHSQEGVPSSHHESDSNVVDSDDSIEQEIRAFLAVKAQRECLITTPKPLSSGQLKRPKRFFPNTLNLALNHKRTLKKEGRVSRPRQNKQRTLSEMGFSRLHSDSHSKHVASQKENVLSSVKNHETSGAATQQEVTPATVSSVDFTYPLAQGLLDARGLVKNTRQVLQKYSTDDKSSSLDSDEDLDTAIKDLLRSKRKLKKKSKDQNIQCKKVRFGNAEMHIFEDKLEILPKKDCKSKNPTLLKSCLIRSRRNIREVSKQKGSRCIVKGRTKSAEVRQWALTFGKGGQTVSGPDCQAAAAMNGQHPWMATPLMEDSNSLDSEDGIEQEIQRFLAEKAKDSSRCVEIAGAFGIVDTMKAANPQTALPKAKRQRSEGGDVDLLKQNKRAKKGCQPMTELKSALSIERESAGTVARLGKQARTCTEDTDSQAAVMLQGNQRIAPAKGAGLSVKRIAVDRKGVSDDSLDQRSLPTWKEKAENCKLQNYFKPMSLFRKKNPREFKISSKSTAGFKGAQTKKKCVLLRKRRGLELPVPQSNVFRRREGLLGEKLKAPVKQEGILVSKCKTEEAELSLRCMAEELYTQVSEKMEAVPLSAEMLILSKARLFDDEEPCPCADSKLSSLFQEPNMCDPSRANVSSLPSEIPVKEKEGEAHDHSDGWEEGLGTSKSCNSPLKETGLDPPRDRIAEKQTQQDVEGGSAEFTDVPMVAHSHGLETNKPSSV